MTAPGEWLILRRELRGTLGRLRLVVVAALWVVVAVIVTYAGWPREAPLTITSAAFILAQESRELLVGQFLVMLSGLLFITPAIAATSFSHERAMDTLDQLRLTPIRESRIVLGKLAAVMTLTLFFIIAILPVFAMTQFLVGLDNTQVACTLAYTIAIATLIASIGVACATVFRSTTDGVAAAYAIVALVLFGPVFLAWGLAIANESFSGPRVFASYHEMVMTTPDLSASSGGPVLVETFLSIAYLAAQFLGPAQVVYLLISGPVGAIELSLIFAMPLTLTAVALFVATRRLRYEAPPVSGREGRTIDDASQLAARRKQFPYYLIDPLRRSPSIGDGQNPVFVREFRYGLFRRTTSMLRAAFVTFALMAMLFALASLQRTPDLIFHGIVLQIFLLVPLVAALLANSLASERESGNLDVLRMSPMASRAILLGKTAGECATVAPLFIAAGCALLPALAARSDCHFLILAGFATLMNCGILGAAIGITAAVVLPRPQTATVAAMATTLSILAGPLLVFMLAAYVQPKLGSQFSARGPSNAALLPMLSPVWSYIHFVSRPRVILVELGEHGVPRLAHLWLASQALFAGIAATILVFSASYFRRYRMIDA